MSAKAVTVPILDSYEAYGCRVNAIDPVALFDRYAEAGFLYPAKRERLAPFMGQIEENWRRALRAGELIHWVATFDEPELDAWASVSSWRSTHGGWSTQHLVSIGSPVGSRAVMLAGQAVRIHDGLDRAHQSWFRPDNRFPNRVFGSLVGSVGEAGGAVIPYQLLALPVGQAERLEGSVSVSELSEPFQADLYGLAVRARGAVYTNAEELAHEDVLLDSVDELYAKVGLRRYRRIWVAWQGDTPIGAVIAYRGPLGFNFSFLENRCDLLVDPRLPAERVAPVAHCLLRAAATTYHDFPPAEMPVVVSDREITAALHAGAKPVRSYTQSIWLQPGFEAMYQHMAGFYERIIRAHRRRGLGSRPPSTDEHAGAARHG